MLDCTGCVLESGTTLQWYTKNGTPAQRFRVIKLNRGYEPINPIKIVPAGNTNVAVNVYGSMLKLMRSTEIKHQEFYYVDRGDATGALVSPVTMKAATIVGA
jgi:hypothetical protein